MRDKTPVCVKSDNKPVTEPHNIHSDERARNFPCAENTNESSPCSSPSISNSPDDATCKHPLTTSNCMKNVRLTCCPTIDESAFREIMILVHTMGGTCRPELYIGLTHCIATNWNSEIVRYFRIANIPVMRPEWVFKCWEMREFIRDPNELDESFLSVFKDMNICVSGFDQRIRANMRKNVIENGGRWQSELLLDPMDFTLKNIELEGRMKTTHSVVSAKTGKKYRAAMRYPDIHIVNLDWFYVSLISRIPQMEDDPKYCLRDENTINQFRD